MSTPAKRPYAPSMPFIQVQQPRRGRKKAVPVRYPPEEQRIIDAEAAKLRALQDRARENLGS